MNTPPASARHRLSALEALAKAFFWEQERLDPSGNFEMGEGADAAWRALPPSEREFYVSIMQRVLLNDDLLIAASGGRLAKNNRVNRSKRAFGSK
jgi:hypothetical protein